MNTNKNGRLSNRRITRTFHLAPATRAIRAALAISFTMLALGGSTVALAGTGTCTTDTTTNTVTCDGDFTNLPGASFVPVADLTLILGDTAPTSVTPGAGIVGVEANWGGIVGVTSHADITTSGADGILEYGSTSATLTNYGAITTNVTAPGAKAIDISAYGNVTAYNSGAVKAYNTGSNDVTAVSASSLFGNVEVYNKAAGTITATAQDGNAVAVDVSAYSTAEIINTGAISASSVNGIAIGALDQSSTARTFFFNEGSITATSTNGQAVGALVSGKEAYASNLAYSAYGLAGSITVTSGADAAIGMEAYGQSYAGAKNTGSITVTSDSGTAAGIVADSYKGAARITNTGSISAKSLYYSPAVGVEAYSAFSGAASVNNSGSIAATAVSGNATGIIAQAHYGQVSVVNSGDVNATAGVGTSYQHNRAIGIVASSGAGYSPGITHVTNSGNISTSGPTLGEGIVGSARYGDLTITNTGTIAAYGQNEAIGIGTGQNGHNAFGNYYDNYTAQVNIDNTGSITAVANGTHCGGCTVAATGIQVFLTKGNSVTATNSGDIDVSVTGTTANNDDNALGIDVFNVNGNVAINNSGSISVANHNNAFADYTAGIIGFDLYGSVSIANSGDINLDVSGHSFKDIGILGISYATVGGISIVNTGTISVNAIGSAIANYVAGISADPHAIGVGDPVSVINSGYIKVNGGYIAAGIGVNSWQPGYVNNSGSVVVSDNDNVVGVRASGIYVVSLMGSASVLNSGDINVGADDTRISGIYARTVEQDGVDHDVAISNSGSITVTGPSSWTPTTPIQKSLTTTGIFAMLQGFGDLTLDNAGTVTVTNPDEGSARGIYAITNGYSGGTSGITNSGDIAVVLDSHLASYGTTAFGVLDRYANRNVNLGPRGDWTFDNSGSISVSVDDELRTFFVLAYGVDVSASDVSAVTVTNSGSITTHVTSSAPSLYLATATGLLVNDRDFYQRISDAISITNSGDITASITANNLLGSEETGVTGYGRYGAAARGIVGISNFGAIAVVNSGTVSASARSNASTVQAPGYPGVSYPGVTASQGVAVLDYAGLSTQGFAYHPIGDMTVSNSATGAITASSVSYGDGAAIASGIYTAVRNIGTTPVLKPASYGISINNAGFVKATAVTGGAATGAATATGISALDLAGGFVNVSNDGTVLASATTSGSGDRYRHLGFRTCHHDRPQRRRLCRRHGDRYQRQCDWTFGHRQQCGRRQCRCDQCNVRRCWGQEPMARTSPRPAI